MTTSNQSLAKSTMKSKNEKNKKLQNMLTGDEMHNELTTTRWKMPTEENKLETGKYDEMNEYETDSKEQKINYGR
eukprot:985907-Amphidinium_carterae.1